MGDLGVAPIPQSTVITRPAPAAGELVERWALENCRSLRLNGWQAPDHLGAHLGAAGTSASRNVAVMPSGVVVAVHGDGLRRDPRRGRRACGPRPCRRAGRAVQAIVGCRNSRAAAGVAESRAAPGSRRRAGSRALVGQHGLPRAGRRVRSARSAVLIAVSVYRRRRRRRRRGQDASVGSSAPGGGARRAVLLPGAGPWAAQEGRRRRQRGRWPGATTRRAQAT